MSLSENIFLTNHKSDFKKGDFINFEKINFASEVIKNFNVDTPLIMPKLVNSLEAIFKNLLLEEKLCQILSY